MDKKKFLKILVISIIIITIISLSIFAIVVLKNQKANADGNNKNEIKKCYYELGDMYCNLKDSHRILRCNITIEFTDEDLMNKFESTEFLINDEINKIIRNKGEKDIEGSEGQNKLQKEITSKLCQLFSSKKITNIYFKELIVQ